MPVVITNGVSNSTSGRFTTKYETIINLKTAKALGPSPARGRRRGDRVSGARYEISIDRVVRTHRDQRDTAVEAAKFLKSNIQTARLRCAT